LTLYVSADARKEEDAQPDYRRISRLLLRSSGVQTLLGRLWFFKLHYLHAIFSYARLGGDRTRKRALTPLTFILVLANPGAGRMRVLVCGGRDFDDAGLMTGVLDRLHTENCFTVVIHGNARGADRIADAWALRRGIAREPYEIPQGEWDEIGKKAGPLRNQRMFGEGKPDLVVAFPGVAERKTWSGVRSRRACQYMR
jgi:hypothetical protein